MVSAARTLILRGGFRATTMEAIAREAGVAKPTLYSQFPDKNAIFAALLDAIITEIVEAADTGFATAGPLWERVGEALSRQHIALSAILNGTLHADELMRESKQTGFRLEERHLRTEARIAEELEGARVRDAKLLARIIASSAHGISQKIADPDTMGRAIKLLCQRLIQPALK